MIKTGAVHILFVLFNDKVRLDDFPRYYFKWIVKWSPVVGGHVGYIGKMFQKRSKLHFILLNYVLYYVLIKE